MNRRDLLSLYGGNKQNRATIGNQHVRQRRFHVDRFSLFACGTDSAARRKQRDCLRGFRRLRQHFAAYKNHIGFYPTPSGVQAFVKETSRYASTKGAIQFPLDEPLPLKLVAKIVKFRVIENLKRAEVKLKKEKEKSEK